MVLTNDLDPNGRQQIAAQPAWWLLDLVRRGATAKKGDMKVDTRRDHGHPWQRSAGRDRFECRCRAVRRRRNSGSGRARRAPPAPTFFSTDHADAIATVSQAGTQTIINGQGAVSFQSSVQLSPRRAEDHHDVFSLKFTDLNNPTPSLRPTLRLDRSQSVPQVGQQ